MIQILIALLFLSPVHAVSKKRPAPVPTVEPAPVVSPVPAPSGTLFVTLGAGTSSSVDRKFAQKALDLMNQAVSSGCLKREVEAHRFKSYNTVFTKNPKDSKEVYSIIMAGAPYALDLHWYSKRGSVVGYTYNFRGDDWDGDKSETRIWSNTRMMDSAESYASHLMHEGSHQARMLGGVHYTIFSGSLPYDLGDIMYSCVGGQ